jgi:hypothetical protein
VYPPSPLTAHTTSLSGLTYGNGQYVTSASSEYNEPGDYLPSWSAFSFFTSWPEYGWTTYQDNYLSGDYNGSTTTFSGVGYKGEWLQIQLPSAINLTQYDIFTYSMIFSRGPESFWLFGSNNGNVWDLLDTRTGVTGYTSSGKTFTLQVAQKFSYFRLVIKKVVGNTFLTVSTLRLYEPDYVSG